MVCNCGLHGASVRITLTGTGYNIFLASDFKIYVIYNFPLVGRAAGTGRWNAAFRSWGFRSEITPGQKMQVWAGGFCKGYGH